MEAALQLLIKEPKKLEAMVAADEMEVKKGKLLSLAFERIILDEAHTIRYPSSLLLSKDNLAYNKVGVGASSRQNFSMANVVR